MGNRRKESKGLGSRYEIIRRELRENWDPIGVGQAPGAFNEYDRYVSMIENLLDEKPSFKEIVEFLWELETDRIGMDGDIENTERFARRLHVLSREDDRHMEHDPKDKL